MKSTILPTQLYTIAKVSTQLSSVHMVDMFYLTHNLKDSRYLSLYFNTWKPYYFSIFLHFYFCTFDSKHTVYT